MTRVMCVRLPHWPLQRLRRCEQPEPDIPGISQIPGMCDHGPLVLYADAGQRGLRVTACSRGALDAGVRADMPLAEAKALLDRRTNNCKLQIENCPLKNGLPVQSNFQFSISNSQFSIPPHEPCFVPHDPAADRAALETLAGWCRRFSPVVGIEDPDSLLLDVTGCGHLFGGEEELARAVAADFQRWGFTVRIALADTIGAAWGFAHYGRDCKLKIENCKLKTELPAPATKLAASSTAQPNWQFSIFNSQFSILPSERHAPPANDEKRSFRDFVAAIRNPQSAIRNSRPRPAPAPTLSQLSTLNSQLAPLPIEALRLPAAAVATLHELDIRRIEQLQALPRSTLPSRFGPEVLRRLDQALGDRPETIAPVRPPEPVEARHEFEHPTHQRFALEAALRRLVEQVLRELAPRMEGVQRLQVRMIYEDRRQDEFPVGLLRPAACAEHVTGLLCTRLERIALSGNVAELRMTVAASAPLDSQQPQLFETGANPAAERELAQLLDRLSTRLGSERVVSPRLHPDAQPEYAVRWEPAGQADATGRDGKLKIENCQLKNGRRSKGNSQFSIFNSQFSISAFRPLRLLCDPQPIDVVSIIPDGPPLRYFRNGRPQTVARWWGPERIETGWWRHDHIRRDYYRVETETGHRFWLFRRPDTWAWFLHGEDD